MRILGMECVLGMGLADLLKNEDIDFSADVWLRAMVFAHVQESISNVGDMDWDKKNNDLLCDLQATADALDPVSSPTMGVSAQFSMT